MTLSNFFTLQQMMSDSAGRVFPAAQLVVRQYGVVIYSGVFGWADPAERLAPITASTLFDLASLTKLFTVTAFMRLVEAGAVALDQPVCTILPAFSGRRPIRPYEDPLSPGAFVTVGEDDGQVDAGAVTFRQLLCHSAGLPAWRPLFRQPNAEAARRMAVESFFSYQPQQHVVYSDIGLILLGMAVEALSGLPLDGALAQLVMQPLGLHETHFLPLGEPSALAAAPTEFCAWRQRRVKAEVHDENAWALGGVSGHAGLFSTAGDVARVGQLYLDGGAPLLQPASVAEMTRVQSQEGSTRRGLGFALWSPDPEASGNPFSPQAFGHTGFTGTSLWIDPQADLVVALLTNEVYYGRINRNIMPLRVAVHRAVLDGMIGTG